MSNKMSNKMGYEIFKKKLGEKLAQKIRSELPSALESNEVLDFFDKLIPIKQDRETIANMDFSFVKSAYLQKFNKKTEEIVALKINPFDLCQSAGYELIECDHKSYFSFKNDFKKDEVICSYNKSATDVFSGKKVFWLRKIGAETIRHANDLDQKYLVGSSVGAMLWRGYLENKGLKTADGYNLPPPTRQDPYGTSSCAIKISKTDGYLTITNRYNHTVNDCDSTFGCDLNNIAPNLFDALFSFFDLKKGYQKSSLPSGVLSSADGSLFCYEREINGISFSRYGFLKDGKLIKVDFLCQFLIDNMLFDFKAKSITDIFTGVVTPAKIKKDGNKILWED